MCVFSNNCYYRSGSTLFILARSQYQRPDFSRPDNKILTPFHRAASSMHQATDEANSSNDVHVPPSISVAEHNENTLNAANFLQHCNRKNGRIVGGVLRD